MDVGSEMLSSTFVGHGSNDRAENGIGGSEKRLDWGNVERGHGDRSPEDRCVPLEKSIASCSGAARDTSSIHDPREISVDRSLGNIVCLMENVP